MGMASVAMERILKILDSLEESYELKTQHAEKLTGTIEFKKGRRNRTFVHVVPEVAETVAPVSKPKPAKEPKPELTKEPAPVKAAATAPEAKEAVKADDLKKIEGIGPKIAELLSSLPLQFHKTIHY